jgi:DNA-binding CsgD family transcriptional regulator
MNISNFIECSNRVESPRGLFDALVLAAADIGFGQVAYGALNYVETIHLADLPEPAVALNYPIEWQKRYFERKYYEVDPVVTYTPSAARPFLWDKVRPKCNSDTRQRAMFSEAREVGLRRGVSFPLHGSLGRVAVMSFATGDGDADPEPYVCHLNALASQFHLLFTAMAQGQSDNPAVELSSREKDCLRWVVQGKSSWDIGAILGISENTVDFHVKKAMRKLKTTSRTTAVVKAIHLGLIDIPDLRSMSFV